MPYLEQGLLTPEIPDPYSCASQCSLLHRNVGKVWSAFEGLEGRHL